jgi:hypothetical protein
LPGGAVLHVEPADPNYNSKSKKLKGNDNIENSAYGPAASCYAEALSGAMTKGTENKTSSSQVSGASECQPSAAVADEDEDLDDFFASLI